MFFSFIKVIVYQRTEQKGHEISSESDADSYESNIRERLLFLTNDKSKSCAEIVANLEKKFYVSSKNKSLYDYLKGEPLCPFERGFPLRKRINIKC